MPDIKLSNKDITIAIIIVFAAFVAIPLLIWGYSNWRINEIAKKATPEIRNVIGSSLPDTEAMIQAISDEYNPKIVETNTYYSRDSYTKSKALAKVACDDLTREISGNSVFKELGILNRSYYSGNCSFGYISEEDVKLVVRSSNVVRQNGMDKDYKRDLDEMLVSSNELPMNIHPHKDQRSIHVLTLLNREPVLLWDITLRIDDNW